MRRKFHIQRIYDSPSDADGFPILERFLRGKSLGGRP